MPILSIRHVTRYRYRKPVALGEHRIMVRPRESYDQRLIAHDLSIGPQPSRLRYRHDVFGNCVGVIEFAEPTTELVFDSFVRLDHAPAPAFAGFDGGVYTGSIPFAYPAEDLPDLELSMLRTAVAAGDPVGAWARRFVRAGAPTRLQQLLRDMTAAIFSEFSYVKRLETGAQAPAQTLQLGSGACRDLAVLMIDAVRSLGLAARFVSGYVYSAHGRAGGGHTHAWVSVYLPCCGWVEFDPTNGIVGSQDLVRVAIARDPGQAAVLQGVYFGEAGDFIDMTVDVDVRAEALEAVDAA